MQKTLFSAVLIYLAFINLYCIFLCGCDKLYSKKKGTLRVPEKTFFLLSGLGASPGMLLSMTLFRHKTKHKSFCLGIPALFAAQTALFLVFFFLYK